MVVVGGVVVTQDTCSLNSPKRVLQPCFQFPLTLMLTLQTRTAMQVDWQDAQTDIILFVRSEAAGMVTGKQGRTLLTILTAQTDFLLRLSLFLISGNLLQVLGTRCRNTVFLPVCSIHSDHPSRHSHCM